MSNKKAHFNLRDNPDPLTKMAEEKNLAAHFESIEALKRSKDMYEACDKVIRNNRKGRIVIAVIIAVILNALLVLELLDNKVTNVPLIICAIFVAETLSALFVVAAILVEPSYIPGNKLKAAIIKQGFDADDVNNDFMRSTINYLANGIMAVGETYCIVYSTEELRIVKLEDITKADQYSIYVRAYRYRTINYYIRLHGKDSTYRDYKFADKLNAGLMLDRFKEIGIKTETFPTGTKAPEEETEEQLH